MKQKREISRKENQLLAIEHTVVVDASFSLPTLAIFDFCYRCIGRRLILSISFLSQSLFGRLLVLEKIVSRQHMYICLDVSQSDPLFIKSFCPDGWHPSPYNSSVRFTQQNCVWQLLLLLPLLFFQSHFFFFAFFIFSIRYLRKLVLFVRERFSFVEHPYYPSGCFFFILFELSKRKYTSIS